MGMAYAEDVIRLPPLSAACYGWKGDPMIKITKTNNDRVRVMFTMPAVNGCGCLYLVGWFGEWNESVYRMQQADDGAWFLTLELEPGSEYPYCFRTSDGTWVYDPDMPQTPSPYGSKNSFVISQNSVRC